MTIRDIKQFPNYYISDTGLVFSGIPGQISSLKPRINNMGYERVILRKGSKNHELLVHRLVAKEFLPEEPERKLVNHKDCNKLNNNAENLEWVTPRENIRHYHKMKKVLT